jgi:hypothetical protein
MKLHFVLAGLILLSACKKHNAGNGGNGGKADTVARYFKDIIIQETLENGSFAPFQDAVGYFQLKSDSNTQIMVASRGTQELNSAIGFRIASINKTNGVVNWVKSYDLPDSNYIQLVTSAAIDNNDNIWVGGHSFAGSGVAGILFLAKLDTSGNMLWSGSFSNYQGWRTYSVTALQNGDVALFAKGFTGFVVLRLTASEQLVWSTIVNYGTGVIDNDFYANRNNSLSPENHAMVETADGSIYVASSSNTGSYAPATDRLYKLDASGNLQFAKIYTPSISATIGPVQLVSAGANNLLLADQINEENVFYAPFFNLVSLSGDVQTCRGYATTANGGIDGLAINEVNFYRNSIYYSTCGFYRFDTYVLDLNLNLQSSEETIADNDIGTDRGGISLYDPAENALFYLCNFGGNSGQSNGFEVTRNDPVGTPCINTYVDGPLPLTLQNIQMTATSDTAIQSVTAGPAPVFTTLGWRNYTVLSTTTVVCGP